MIQRSREFKICPFTKLGDKQSEEIFKEEKRFCFCFRFPAFLPFQKNNAMFT
jgi:hypothetical protein